MTIPYNEPGVTIRELESPSFNVPTTGAPTLAAIVGPSRGYRTVTDTLQLTDGVAQTLSASGVDVSTLTVVDAEDPNGAAFVETTASNGDSDYTLVTSGDVTTIQRSMQTTIGDGEEVVTYFEDDEDDSATVEQSEGKTGFVTLDRLTAAYVDGTATGSNQTQYVDSASLRVQNAGQVHTDDYTVAGSGTAGATIVYENTNGVIGKFQTLYLDYTMDGTDYIDQAVQLNDATPVVIDADAVTSVSAIVVKNAPGLGSSGLATADAYGLGTTTDSDYIVTGSGTSLKIARSQGSTTIGGTDDTLRVFVTYQASPANYWTPTRITSPAEAEAKYGPALDANGAISSPLTFAAGLAFANGAAELILQPLFAAGPVAPTGSDSDWSTTLEALRVQEDVNVIVPIIGVGGPVLTSSDPTIRSIISAVKSHIDFMRALNIRVLAICGTDSTLAGQGEQATRRTLAQTFASEDITIMCPARFDYVNNANRRISVGGQYAAAAFAGMLSRYPVQATMTRKTMGGLVAVTSSEVVNRQEKNRDAASGLTVLENVAGRIRVRHALTTDVSSITKSELNVVRSKHFLLDAIYDVMDEQIIGQVVADESAPITVQVALDSVLQSMQIQGVVVSYGGISARLSNTNPTQMDLRFAYKPPFALNYISVEFSIDLGQGSLSFTNTPAPGA